MRKTSSGAIPTQLQELHQEYREIGPVSKELREQIWARFKAASTVINKRHQQHFEEMRANEEENLEKKTALCEKVESIVAAENKGAADWEKRTKEIIDIQAEWKTIGFAPQKMNVKIFERFKNMHAMCSSRVRPTSSKPWKRSTHKNAEKEERLVEKGTPIVWKHRLEVYCRQAYCPTKGIGKPLAWYPEKLGE